MKKSDDQIQFIAVVVAILLFIILGIVITDLLIH